MSTNPKISTASSAIDENSGDELPRYNRSSIWLVLVVLLITSAIIVWNTWVRQQEHALQEFNTVRNSVDGTAREINILLNEIRRSVKLLGQREQALLRTIATNPSDIDAYDLLVSKVKQIFPHTFAVTLANAKGEPYIEDFDGFILEVCRRDISNFAHESHPPEIYIHPNPYLYHFDIMTRIDLGLDGESIFFISFKPDLIAKVLAASQLYQHNLVLLKQDRPGLVEITAEGTRQNLQEDRFFLSATQLNQIKYTKPVENTLWNLVSLEDENIANRHFYRVWGEVLVQLLFLCTLSLFMIRYLDRSGRKIISQSNKIARHAREIEKNEKRLERAQQIANMGHWDFDLTTDTLSLSDGACRIFNIEPGSQAHAQQISQKIYPVDRARVKRLIAVSIVKQIPGRTEFRLQNSTGEISIISASVELTKDINNNPLQLFGIVQDVTLQKEAEESSRKALIDKLDAESASEAKSLFLANMSHEIRTPLTAIIGFAEALLQSDQPMQERTNAIKTILRNSDHLLNIINDILDLSKIEAEKLEVEQTSFNPFHILSDIESLLRIQTREKGLDFAINYHYPIPAFIVSDPLRLKQILINICSNAVKFTEKGFIHINVGYDNHKDKVWFKIIDSGIGMNEDEQKRIFETFTQADLSTTRKYGGTGLGLTISKFLSEMMGGAISVTSHPGSGSQFLVNIRANVQEGVPFISNEGQIPKETPMLTSIQQVNSLSGSILLAEDNEDNQRLLSMYIRKMGASLTIVADGKQALEAATEQDYDLILMDMQMPVMDGLEAVKRLRKNHYHGPIAALTANAMSADKERCLSAGCNDFVTKPIHRHDLYQVISKYLKTVAQDSETLPAIHSLLLQEEPDLADIVARFVNNLPATVEKLSQVAKQNDWQEVYNIIHQIKGVGGSYGYPELTDVAAKTQFQLENEFYDEVTVLIGQLENIASRIYAGLYPDSQSGTAVSS